MTTMELKLAGIYADAELPARVEEIIFHEVEAEKLEADATKLGQEADGHRWEAARLIFEEISSGKSQRQLAREIGKSYEHVRIMAKTWNIFGKCQPRLAFNVAYHSPGVRGTAKKETDDKPVISLGSIEELADFMLDNPEEAEKIHSATRKAVARAKEKIHDGIESDPKMKNLNNQRKLEEAEKKFKEAAKALQRFTELYKPTNRTYAERLIEQLEGAIQIIRLRIVGME